MENIVFSEQIIYKRKKFLSTEQKIQLYKISKMIYDDYPLKEITDSWIKIIINEKKINIQKSANYVYRRLHEFILSDADFIRRKIKRMKTLKKNLQHQLNKNNELVLFDKIILPIKEKIKYIDSEIKYERKKLNSIYYKNKQTLHKLDLFLERFRISSRPIWRYLRYISPTYYFKKPWQDYLRKNND